MASAAGTFANVSYHPSVASQKTKTIVANCQCRVLAGHWRYQDQRLRLARGFVACIWSVIYPEVLSVNCIYECYVRRPESAFGGYHHDIPNC